MRKGYSNNDVQAAIMDLEAGSLNARDASKKHGVPYSTLTEKFRKHKANDTLEPSKRGPPPILTRDGEEHLVAWVVAMQSDGLKQELGDGWYTRFINRYHQLSNRMSQVISRARNAVNASSIDIHFD
ncbi:hypothetical protein AC1031_016758 [Aphanomyces cochlioides]|nr:hypothetical protein AC1031_016758 [Aphanomyces cochlioides]